MPKPDWSRISDAENFYALVRAIISRSDPLPHRVWLPTGPGRDLAIDARSGDGTTVWQFKYHQPGTKTDRIFSDAVQEIHAIEKARKTEKGKVAWAPVSRWMLATSLFGRPQDYVKWEREVVPRFRDIGLEAELRDFGKLEVLLLGLPDVHKHFFDNEDSCFESLAVFRGLLLADQPGAKVDVEQFLVPNLIGRDAEMAKVREQIRRCSLSEVVGVGGVGKTRFLLEVAQQAMDAGDFKTCLCGRTEDLAGNPGWSQHLPSDRALVLVDEPDRKLFASIAEVARRQPAGGGLTFLVAVRPGGAERTRPGHTELGRSDPVELGALKTKESREFVTRYLQALAPGLDWRDSVADEVARLCGGLPVWMAAAVACIVAGRELPKELDELAQSQVAAAIGGRPDAAQLREILRWLSLVQPLRTDAGDIDLLASLAGLPHAAIENGLPTLASLRLVRRRGRLWEAHPDTLADAVVRNWLLRQEPAPGAVELSKAGKTLVDRLLGRVSAAPLEHIDRILARLARVESMAGREADILGAVLRQVLHEAEAANNASSQKALLDRVTPLAYWRPSEVVDVLATLRKRAVPDDATEFAHGYSLTTHRNDVLLALPWPMYSAGCGASDEAQVGKVLHELLELVRVEARLLGDDPERARNDGKRAVAVVEKLVHPSRHHPLSYVPAAWAALEPLLATLRRSTVLPSEDLAVVRCLAKPLLCLEFHDDWRDGWQIHIQKVVIRDEIALDVRQRLRDQLWLAVTGAAAPGVHRKVAWDLLDESHRHDAYLETRDCQNQRADDLRRSAELLEQVADPLDVWESRRIWHWHLRYDDDASMQALAQRCEHAFRAHTAVFELARLCRMLQEPEDGDDDEPARGAIIEQWARRPAQEIRGFLHRASRLALEVRDERLRTGVVQVAADIGWSGWNLPAVHDLCREGLSEGDTDNRAFGWALTIGCTARAARELPADAFAHQLREVLLWPAVATDQAELARRLYQQYGALTLRKLTIFELEVLWPHLLCLVASAPKDALAIVGRFAVVDVVIARARAQALLDRVPAEELNSCYATLIGGMSHGCFQELESKRVVPSAIRDWLKDLLGEIPNLDFGDTHAAWWLREVFVAAPLTLLEALHILQQRLALGPALEVRYPEDSPRVRHGFRPTWRPIPMSFEFEKVVASQGAQVDIEAIRPAMATLLQMALDAGPDAYGFDELLPKLDPTGDAVGLAIIALLDSADPGLDLNRFARIAGMIANYGDGSTAWRRVAINAFGRLGPGITEAQRRALIGALWPSKRGVWTGTPGEVHPRFQAAVDRAQRLLDEESEPLLLPYRQAALKDAKQGLEQERARCEEEAMHV